ncbi:hypothetical protein J4558_09720 [Leptolyngbya sp. 15MV]|nr:hypothetical protein J4558_09720 [Leptolyngbya sp. 15MV]
MTRPGASADPRLDPSPDAARLAGAISAGSRADLARAITLVESTRPDHRQCAGALLAMLAPHAGGAMRLGITGLPGAGKSTFIERLGGMLVAHGRRVPRRWARGG